jgi:hypothetical protein
MRRQLHHRAVVKVELHAGEGHALARRLPDADQDLDSAVPAFPEACARRRLSPRTVEWFTHCLRPCAGALRSPPHDPGAITVVVCPNVR